jgi:putative Ca2+/H+ antiporter (TMEM165/GDT1 family)
MWLWRPHRAPDGTAHFPGTAHRMLESLLVSIGIVAIGEIGDKTQLLSLVLAARYRKPWPIVAGIAVATLANHAIAGWVGNWVRGVVPADVLKWLLALSFFAVAAWALKPDTYDGEPTGHSRWGVFGVTVVAFFLAEIGDKTQVATVMLAAKFPSLLAVVIGTTIGMLIANAPVVFAGNLAADRIPFKAIRVVAAVLFAALGAWVLVQGLPAEGSALPPV